MIQLDNETLAAIINKSGMGSNNTVTVTRENITKLSNSFTDLQNALNAVQTYSNNVKKIRKAVIQGTKVESAETQLENSSAQLESGASASGVDGIESLLPQITQALEQLGKSVEQLDLSASSQPTGGMDMGRGRGPSLKTIGKIGLGVAAAGAVGYGAYSLMSGGDEEAPEPERGDTPPTPPAPPPPPPPSVPAPTASPQSKPAAEQSKNEKATLKAIDKFSKKKDAEKEDAPQLTPNAKTYTDSILASIQNGVASSGDNSRTSQQAMATPVGQETDTDNSGGGDLTSGSYDLKIAKLLANYEGIRTEAYKDTRGIPTIGIGATYYPPGFRLRGKVQMGQTITEEEAHQVKAAHVEEHRGRLLREVSSSDYSTMPEGVKAALESKVFNYGSLGGTLAGLTKTAVKTKNYRPVSNYFKTTLAAHNSGTNAWRRNDEAALIDTGRSPRAKISFGSSSGSGGGANIGGFGGGASGGGSKGIPGKDIKNTDNINQSTKGKNIWDYARKNGSDIDYDGLKPGMKNRFLAMAMEYKQKTGAKLAINSANRTYAKQAAIFKKYGPNRAAPPGRSKHESGVAIDINSTDGNAVHKLGLLKKYGFFRPYASEPWHVEPIEAAKVKGQTDNPYNPGSPIVQTGKGSKPVIQNDSGKTKAVTQPARQLGPPSEGVAIQQKVGERQVATTVVPVRVGGNGPTPGPAQYLAGIPSPKPPKTLSRNPVREYKAYFNAA